MLNCPLRTPKGQSEVPRSVRMREVFVKRGHYDHVTFMTSLTVLSAFPVVASLPPKRGRLETRAEKNRMLSQATLCRSSWGTLSKRIAALFLRRNFILVSCSLETNFVPPWKSQAIMFIVWSEWRVRVWSGAKTTRLRLGRSILSCEYSGRSLRLSFFSFP